ncbi:hypothetical protein EVAR_29987_1 [Eumeta japonica]|uniref:Uncharacterized protein n=1 Tax=Eumeta variegata TaxID=151549 RepID=A0A4C1VJA7_EUMVA|nr:hypothetical protein EVAR_29987_1 [Eumeta japonica]
MQEVPGSMLTKSELTDRDKRAYGTLEGTWSPPATDIRNPKEITSALPIFSKEFCFTRQKIMHEAYGGRTPVIDMVMLVFPAIGKMVEISGRNKVCNIGILSVDTSSDVQLDGSLMGKTRLKNHLDYSNLLFHLSAASVRKPTVSDFHAAERKTPPGGDPIARNWRVITQLWDFFALQFR